MTVCVAIVSFWVLALFFTPRGSPHTNHSLWNYYIILSAVLRREVEAKTKGERDWLEYGTLNHIIHIAVYNSTSNIMIQPENDKLHSAGKLLIIPKR